MGEFAAVSSVAQAGASIGGAISQSGAIKAQGEYQSQQMAFNAQLADLQAKDAIKRGAKASNKLRTQGKQLIGRQRAALAAQGVVVDVGSAAEVQADTASQVSLDAVEITNNAWRESLGYQIQASNYRAESAFTKISSEFNAKNTMITGGLQSLSYLGKAGSQAYDAGLFDRWSTSTSNINVPQMKAGYDIFSVAPEEIY